MLAETLKEVLRDAGAALIGFGDMTGVAECEYPRGVSVAVPVPIHILKEIQDGPTWGYYHTYNELNTKLDQIITRGKEYLESEGYSALIRKKGCVYIDEDQRTHLPHKTVATRAGLGWIGKSNLLVTPEYGPAVRISALLTDAPLPCSEPINDSRCGNCDICQRACPAQAIYGTLWHAGMDRDKFFNMPVCHEKQFELVKERLGIHSALCGKCFVVCPYTRKYMSLREEI